MELNTKYAILVLLVACLNLCTASDAVECNCIHGVCSVATGGTVSCVCDQYFTGNQCQTNVNECVVEPSICGDVNKDCTDTSTGYTCECKSGFLPGADGMCEETVIWTGAINGRGGVTKQGNAESTISLIVGHLWWNTFAIPFFDYSSTIMTSHSSGFVMLGEYSGTSFFTFSRFSKSLWPVFPFIIAPYWSTGYGQDSESFFKTGEAYIFSTDQESSSMLAFAQDAIRPTYSDFTPQAAKSMTWYKLKPSRDSTSNERITFQLIVATDYTYSFAIINWHSLTSESDIDGGPDVISGYSGPDGGFVPLTAAPNTRKVIPLFSSGSPNGQALECYNRQKNTQASYPSLLKCPCNEDKAKTNFDLEYVAAKSTTERKCYYDRFFQGGVKRECCYNPSGYHEYSREPLIQSGTEGDKARETKAVHDFCCDHNPFYCDFFKAGASSCTDHTTLVGSGGGYGSLHINTFADTKSTLNELGEFVIYKAGDVELQVRTLRRVPNEGKTYFSAFALKTMADRASYQIYVTSEGSLAHGWTSGTPAGAESFVIDTSVTDKIVIMAPHLKLTVEKSASNSLEFLLEVATIEMDGGFIRLSPLTSTRLRENRVENESASLFDYTKPSATSYSEVNDQTGFTSFTFPLQPFNLIPELAVRNQGTLLCGDDKMFCRQEFALFRDTNGAATAEKERKQKVEQARAVYSKSSPSVPESFLEANGRRFTPSELNSDLTYDLSTNNTDPVTFHLAGSEIAMYFTIENDQLQFTGNVSALRELDYPQNLEVYVTNTVTKMTTRLGSYIRWGFCLCEDDSQCLDNNNWDTVDKEGTLMHNNIFQTPCGCFSTSASSYPKAGGRYCDQVVDPCTDCFTKDRCDTTGPFSANKGDYCGTCPEGLHGDGMVCKAFDYCKDNNGGCEQICTNSDSKAVCSCRDGYELQGNNCLDINECRRNTTLCDSPHICFNTMGSYECRCLGNRLGDDCTEANYVVPGLVKLSPMRGQTSDITEAQKKALMTKIASAIKTKLTTGANAIGTTDNLFVEVAEIKDISSRSKRATNPDPELEASYIVRSSSGTFSSSDFPAALAISGCEVNCDLNGLRVFSAPVIITNQTMQDVCDLPLVNTCDPTSSFCTSRDTMLVYCSCKRGFQVSEDPNVCRDIDECSTGVHKCPTGSTCQNLVGSYTCACPTDKYYDSVFHKCRDDPCLLEHTCPKSAICIPSDSGLSFYCKRMGDNFHGFDNDDDDDGWKTATIVVSCVLGVLCIILIAAVIFLVVRGRENSSDVSGVYNNRSFDGMSNKRASSTEMANRHAYDNYDAQVYNGGNRGEYL